MKSLVHRAAIRAERFWDKRPSKRVDGEIFIHSYDGYSTPHGCQVRGRLLSKPQPTGPALTGAPLAGPSLDGPPVESLPVESLGKFKAILDAVVAMAGNFMTAERAGIQVKAAGQVVRSDEEGYFHLHLDAGTGTGSDVDHVDVYLPEHGVQTVARIFQTSADAAFGIISDVDDTVMRTGAHWLPLNLWTTFTTAVGEREVFADSKRLLNELCGETNPMFYVSSSPWNLHSYLQTVFAANGLPDGPLFLRDLGIDEEKFIKPSHGSHKEDAISTILEANPGLPFILIGDSGQHDAMVYKDVIERHPGRIQKVFIRQAGALDSEDALALAAIEATGVAFFAAPDFAVFLK